MNHDEICFNLRLQRNMIKRNRRVIEEEQNNTTHMSTCGVFSMREEMIKGKTNSPSIAETIIREPMTLVTGKNSSRYPNMHPQTEESPMPISAIPIQSRDRLVLPYKFNKIVAASIVIKESNRFV